MLGLVGVVVFAGLITTGVVRVGVAVVEAGHARAAADAAALAATHGGLSAAERVAHLNAATIIDYDDSDGRVRLVVRVGSTAAGSTAELYVPQI